ENEENENKRDKTNFKNLLIAEMIDLNYLNFNETENSLNLNKTILEELEVEKSSDIDIETIYEKEFQ
ncbi:6960_t:CDS:1, partial [Scutellospora calospora]